MDPVDQPLKGDKFTVVTTLVDNSDAAAAVDLAEKAIKEHPNVKCAIGLLSYSAPALVKGIAGAGKTVKIIGFDVDDQTLTGIENGQISATIMQDQYGCGYHAVRILGQDARGDRSELPVFDKQTLPCNVVTKDNIASIRARLSGQPAPTTNAG
jgi:ribose transport system substrate-binding protein